ncbi:recombinase family protein [Chelatococcus reniformis]|nr:recombinase family protein [Chelatococcus reniformis]
MTRLDAEGCADIVLSLGLETGNGGLSKLVNELQPGDRLVVPSLASLGLDAQGIVRLISRLYRDSIQFAAVEDNVSSATIGQFCLKLNKVAIGSSTGVSGRRRTVPGIEARAKQGRPAKLTTELLYTILILSQSNTLAEISRAVGLSKSTVWRCLRQHRAASGDVRRARLPSESTTGETETTRSAATVQDKLSIADPLRV